VRVKGRVALASGAAAPWQFVFTWAPFYSAFGDEATGQRVPATRLRLKFPPDMPPLTSLEFQMMNNSICVPFAAVVVDDFRVRSGAAG
jgi:hypothetical protein